MTDECDDAGVSCPKRWSGYFHRWLREAAMLRGEERKSQAGRLQCMGSWFKLGSFAAQAHNVSSLEGRGARKPACGSNKKSVVTLTSEVSA